MTQQLPLNLYLNKAQLMQYCYMSIQAVVMCVVALVCLHLQTRVRVSSMYSPGMECTVSAHTEFNFVMAMLRHDMIACSAKRRS